MNVWLRWKESTTPVEYFLRVMELELDLDSVNEEFERMRVYFPKAYLKALERFE